MKKWPTTFTGVAWLIVIVISVSKAYSQANIEIDSSAPINDIAWNSDGTLLAIGYENTIEIVDVGTDQRSTFNIFNPQDTVRSVAWSPLDSDILAIGTRHGSVQIVGIVDNQFEMLFDLPTHQNYVRQIEWSPDGKRLASIGETGGGATSQAKIQVWNTENGKLLAALDGEESSFVDMAWNPNHPNELLATSVTNNYPATILLWDVDQNAFLWKVREEIYYGVTYVAWNADGSSFAAITPHILINDDVPPHTDIRIYDRVTGTATLVFPSVSRIVSLLEWNINGDLAVSGLDIIEFWNPVTNKLIGTISIGAISTNDFVNKLAWKPDGSIIAYILSLSGQRGYKVGFTSPTSEELNHP